MAVPGSAQQVPQGFQGGGRQHGHNHSHIELGGCPRDRGFALRVSELVHGGGGDHDRRGKRAVQEAAGGGDGRDVDKHAWTDMDPTEGLPVAIERSAIVGATRVVVEDRFGELGLGLGFEIMTG